MTDHDVYSNIEQLPLVLLVDDLMPVLKIGRNAAYDLVRSGKIKALRIGNSYRIPGVNCSDSLGNLPEIADGAGETPAPSPLFNFDYRRYCPKWQEKYRPAATPPEQAASGRKP